METIFSHIVQKRLSHSNEDIATDALAFILHTSEYARIGFMRLLRSLEPQLPDLLFRTQQSEGNIRPDMWGFHGSNPCVFVENKFWAGLTDNQPVSYLRQLAKFIQPTILLVVVPTAREQSIWRELIARLNSEGIVATNLDSPSGIVFSAATDLGPTIALTSWNKLLSSLELEASEDRRTMGDLLQLRSLCEATDSDAFTPVSAEEITNQETPAFILKMNTIVEDSVQAAISDGVLDISGLRPQASWDRIGRYIRFPIGSDVGCWIGLSFELWKQHGRTPIWLSFASGDWGRSEEVSSILEPWVRNEGLVSNLSRDHYFVGLSIVTSEEKEMVVRSIVSDLRKISSVLSKLPQTVTDVESNNE